MSKVQVSRVVIFIFISLWRLILQPTRLDGQVYRCSQTHIRKGVDKGPVELC